jgi:hypothetical protein
LDVATTIYVEHLQVTLGQYQIAVVVTLFVEMHSIDVGLYVQPRVVVDSPEMIEKMFRSSPSMEDLENHMIRYSTHHLP